MKRFVSVALSCLFIGFGACGDDHADDESPAADACEHLADGPIAQLMATLEPGTAPAAAALHTRYDITLGDMGGVPGGFVTVPVTEAGEHLIYTNAAVVLTVTDLDGTTVAAEASGSSDADCALVGNWAHYDLGVGTYTVEIAAAAGINTVSLVRLQGSDAHGH